LGRLFPANFLSKNENLSQPFTKNQILFNTSLTDGLLFIKNIHFNANDSVLMANVKVVDIGRSFITIKWNHTNEDDKNNDDDNDDNTADDDNDDDHKKTKKDKNTSNIKEYEISYAVASDIQYIVTESFNSDDKKITSDDSHTDGDNDTDDDKNDESDESDNKKKRKKKKKKVIKKKSSGYTFVTLNDDTNIEWNNIVISREEYVESDFAYPVGDLKPKTPYFIRIRCNTQDSNEFQGFSPIIYCTTIKGKKKCKFHCKSIVIENIIQIMFQKTY